MITNPQFGKWNRDDWPVQKEPNGGVQALDYDREEAARIEHKSYPCITRIASKDEIDKYFNDEDINKREFLKEVK